MREVVDREAELEALRAVAFAPRPSLTILRGRRRVGKSFLLRAAIPEGRVVSFQADEQDETAQLSLLAQEASRLLRGAPPLVFGDWEAAFQFFGQQAEQDALVVIFDEFQYLCAAQPALPSVLQRHWDDWERTGLAIALIVAGSALSFMDGLLSHGSPLYGRASYRPLLLPLDFRQATEFAPAGAAPRSRIERYGVLGGTPQYQVWAGARPLRRVIREVILAKGAPLYEEPLQLVRGEEGVRDPLPYFSILRALGHGDTRTGDIASKIGLDTSHTAKLLERLAALGYVELREPLVPRGAAKARSLWRIADPYFRFWFRYVFPNRSRLERELVEEVLVEIESDLDTYMGPIFEDVCRTWLGRYSQLGSDSTGVGSWWSRRSDADVDVVAIRDDDYRVLGSCKWTHRPGARMLDQLYEHRALLGARAAQARLVLFARDGFPQELRKRGEAEDISLVSATDLFAEAS